MHKCCFRCMVFLMTTAAAVPEGEACDDSVVASLEHLGSLFYLIALEVSSWDITKASQARSSVAPIVVPPWAVPFAQSAARITQHLLESCLKVFALHDEDTDAQHITEDMGQEDHTAISAIASPFLIDMMRQFAVIGQCVSSETARCLHSALEQRFTALQRASASQSAVQLSDGSHVTDVYDQLFWLLGYCCYFIVEPKRPSAPQSSLKAIPRSFILQGDSCQAEVKRLNRVWQSY